MEASGLGADYCRDCRKAKRQAREEPPCSTCSNRCPDLDPDNRPAWDLFLACRTQWRAAPMGGTVGMDYGSVYLVAGSLRVPMHRGNLERIQALEELELKIQNAEARDQRTDGR